MKIQSGTGSGICGRCRATRSARSRKASNRTASTRSGSPNASAVPRPIRCSRSRTRRRARSASSSARAFPCCPGAVPRWLRRSGPPSTCCPAAAPCPRSGSGSRIPSNNRRSASTAATAPRSSTRRCPLIRRLWTEPTVDHDGRWFHYEQMSVLPKPSHPLDVWLGGRAPSELRRVGRLGDGWLASFSSPQQCKDARVAIEDAADCRRPRDRSRALRCHGALHARRDSGRVRRRHRGAQSRRRDRRPRRA